MPTCGRGSDRSAASPSPRVTHTNLLVYPLLLGKGKRLFSDGPRVELQLAETKRYASGVVLLQLQPAS